MQICIPRARTSPFCVLMQEVKKEKIEDSETRDSGGKKGSPPKRGVPVPCRRLLLSRLSFLDPCSLLLLLQFSSYTRFGSLTVFLHMETMHVLHLSLFLPFPSLPFLSKVNKRSSGSTSAMIGLRSLLSSPLLQSGLDLCSFLCFCSVCFVQPPG